MPFITEDFLLHNRKAKQLFRAYAADQPIFDYHCHLPPKDIAENRRFRNLFEIWLEGDHYKWRAMRANGWTNAIAPATPLRTKSFLPGLRPSPTRCAIRFTTGPTWN